MNKARKEKEVATIETKNAMFGIGLLMIAGLGCGGAQPHEPQVDRLSPSVLFPMKQGYVWSYDVDTGEGLNTLAISRVLSVRAGRVEMSTGGSEAMVYQTGRDGISRGDDDTWVLKAPIKKDARWKSPVGQAIVLSTDEKVSTKAGEFKDCVRIQEQSEDASRQVDTVYCPEVGPVLIDSRMTLKLAGGQSQVVARLLGYTQGTEP
ncbi:MAG: hypothetical protein IPJ88_05240 [Myxococcales bacterium]|nr:MAG: hypothetical protein IPJ88_05240 [Myxococcales bacterium]